MIAFRKVCRGGNLEQIEWNDEKRRWENLTTGKYITNWMEG